MAWNFWNRALIWLFFATDDLLTFKPVNAKDGRSNIYKSWELSVCFIGRAVSIDLSDFNVYLSPPSLQGSEKQKAWHADILNQVKFVNGLHALLKSVQDESGNRVQKVSLLIFPSPLSMKREMQNVATHLGPVGFIVVLRTLENMLLPTPRSWWWKRTYIVLHSGFFLDAITDNTHYFLKRISDRDSPGAPEEGWTCVD